MACRVHVFVGFADRGQPAQHAAASRVLERPMLHLRGRCARGWWGGNGKPPPHVNWEICGEGVFAGTVFGPKITCFVQPATAQIRGEAMAWVGVGNS